jgi:hypothetical protein
LPGLRYRERRSAIGGVIGFAGEPRLTIEIEHERLPGLVVIDAKEAWRVALVEPLTVAFRRWVAEN